MALRIFCCLAALACAAASPAHGLPATPGAAIALPAIVSVGPPPRGGGVAHEADPDLPADYVEEEFLVSGRGRVFGYDDRGEAKVVSADHPWTTRVLVRHPRDPRRASGWAFVEPLHPEVGRSFAWRQSAAYLARSGDTWIGVTTVRNLDLYGAGDPLQQLKAFDKDRYAAVQFGIAKTEGGLTWDVIAGVGTLARSGRLTGGMPVRKTMIGGWSGAGALTLFFANTFMKRERLPDGGPIFDAVLLGEPGWYPRINAASGDPLPYDIRQRPAPLDVPTISVSSTAPIEFGMPFRPRADSDAAEGRYRAFEIAGANHRGRLHPFGGDLTKLCGGTMSDFPLDAYYSLAIDWLKRWSDRGEAPPASRPIRIDRYGQVAVDAKGNPVGGVRSPELDVPIARYFQTHDAALVACRGGGRMERLLRSALVRRYGTKAGYVAAVRARASSLVREGWLLRPDANAAVARAGSFDGFDRPRLPVGATSTSRP